MTSLQRTEWAVGGGLNTTGATLPKHPHLLPARVVDTGGPDLKFHFSGKSIGQMQE